MADRFDVGSARNVVLGIGKVSPALFVSSRERPAVGFMAGSRQAPGPLKVERELLRLSGDDGRDTAPPRRRRGELPAAAQAACMRKNARLGACGISSGGSFGNFLRNGLTLLSLRGSVGADTKTALPRRAIDKKTRGSPARPLTK